MEFCNCLYLELYPELTPEFLVEGGCVPRVYPGKLYFDRSFNLNLNPELYPALYPELYPELISASLYILLYCFCSRFGYFAFLDRGL